MASKRDYYEVLGVSKTASDNDIKRAFKRLAMKYHPDRNKEADAQDKFREINEAYQVLSDPQKRSAYDAGGFDAVDGNGFGAGGFDPFGGGDAFSDIFSAFFGEGMGGGRRSRPSGPMPERGRDMRIVVNLTLEEAVQGVTKELKVNALYTCPECKGEGTTDPKSRQTCPQCHGQGVVIQANGFFRVQQTCPKCKGEGIIFTNPCKKCHGDGRTKQSRNVVIKIPGGLDTGQFVTINGAGEAGRHGGPAGNLLAVVNILEHSLFKRDGDNLYCEVPISFGIAALGGKVMVPTLDGKLAINIEPGTQTGTPFRIPNKGIQSPIPGRPKGHLYCTVVVETPINLTDYQKDLLKKLEESLEGSKDESSSDDKKHIVHKPKSDAFVEKVFSFFKNLGKNESDNK